MHICCVSFTVPQTVLASFLSVDTDSKLQECQGHFSGIICLVKVGVAPSCKGGTEQAVHDEYLKCALLPKAAAQIILLNCS